jgi:hypothetical protein
MIGQKRSIEPASFSQGRGMPASWTQRRISLAELSDIGFAQDDTAE